MTVKTHFSIQLFVRGRGGKLRPAQPQPQPSEAQALRAAERLQASAPAGMVVAQDVDGDDLAGPPRVLKRWGEVPDEAIEALAA